MGRRIYYHLTLTLASPLSIGSGEKESTDRDIVLDSRSLPVIPASALAGVFRHRLYDVSSRLFGRIDGGAESSDIVFYDGTIVTDSFVTIRDSVALEEGCKTAVASAKFDLEAAETGAAFETVIELRDEGCEFSDMVENTIGELNAGLLRIGSKSTRGYGEVRVTELYKAEFAMPDDADKWLDFDMFSKGSCAYQPCDAAVTDSGSFIKITLQLSQRGGISIRQYTSSKLDNENKGINYQQMSLSDGTPIIPGTTWAGAFRSRFTELAGGSAEKRDELFGSIKGDGHRSRIYFSESRISGHTWKKLTRNSIDRFSAKTKDGALYTERTVFGGKSELNIAVSDITKEEAALLSAVICDLNNGFLAVGGLTAVGRGLFSVDSLIVNGEDRTDKMNACDIGAMLEVK